MSQPSSNEDQLWKKWVQNPDAETGDSLIRIYTPLVNFHVQRIGSGLPRNINKDELMSLGMVGLYDAMQKFDPTRDLKFDTYASFRIRGAIIDGLRKEDWLPRSLREKSKKIDEVTERLEQKYMRNITPAEIATELGITEEEVTTTVSESFFANMLSMDETPKDNEEEQSKYTLKDDKSLTPEQEMIKGELHLDLAEAIKMLNEKEQLVISLFYHEELTLTEIGQVLSLSTSRISQIHSKAIYKLRTVLNKIT
jgi:RNA polymerase sigma factor FliA